MLKNLAIWLLIGIAVIMALSVAALTFGEGEDFGNSIFISVSLLMQGEPMNLDPDKITSPIDKVVIALVMVSGTVLMAVIFALITDRVLSLRLDYLLGKRGIPVMKDHIIVVGIGSVGFRTWQALRKFPADFPIIVMDKNADNPRLEEIRRAGDTVIVDDPRLDQVLEKASVGAARTIICATNDDLANLDIALTAREKSPNIRVVLRMYDQRLAKKVSDGFNIQVALSSSGLAAPAFAAAAYDRSIVNSYYLGQYQVVTARVHVGKDSKLANMSTRDFERDYKCALLKHISKAGEGELYPFDEKPIEPGDVLMVSSTYEQLKSIKADANDTFT